MLDLCRTLQNKIHQLSFESLWPGFHPFPFALYDDKEVFFINRKIPWDSRFVGNTAIPYEGETIVLWNFSESPISDLDVLASKLVHEMFQAFQKEANETRWPDEFQQGLRYRYDSDNLCKKFMEDFHLCGFLTSFSPETWKILMAVRNGRAIRYPDLVDYESRIETIEGIAEYVELSALRKLDEAKYQLALQAIVQSLNEPSQLLPIHQACHHSGALLCVLAERHGMDFKHPIGKETKTLYQLLSQGIPPRDHSVKIHSVIREVEQFQEKRGGAKEFTENR